MRKKRKIEETEEPAEEESGKLIIADFNESTPPDSNTASLSGAAEKARNTAMLAFEQENLKKGIKLAKKALYIWPDCVEAYIYLAETDAKNLDQALNYFDKAVKAAEKTLSPETIEKHKGKIWDLIEARPYMIARISLASHLVANDELEEAVQQFWDILELDADDVFDMRYMLAKCLFTLEDYENLQRLWKIFSKDDSSAWLYDGALLTYTLEGNSRKAVRILKKALKANPLVPEFLLNPDSMPLAVQLPFESGSKNEAVHYALANLDFWEDVETSLEWLSEISGVEMPEYDDEYDEETEEFEGFFDPKQIFTEEMKRRIDELLDNHKCLRNSDDIHQIIGDSFRIGGLPRARMVMEQVFSPEEMPVWKNEQEAKDFNTLFFILWNKSVNTEKFKDKEAGALLFSALPRSQSDTPLRDMARLVIARHDRILLFLRYLDSQGKFPDELPQNAAKHLAYWDNLIEQTALFIKRKGKKSHPTELKKIVEQIETGDEIIFDLFRALLSGEDVPAPPPDFIDE